MICSKCGANNQPEAHFCEDCGAPLLPAREEVEMTKATALEPTPSPEKKKPKKKKAKAIIAIFCVVALVVGTFGMIHLFSEDPEPLPVVDPQYTSLGEGFTDIFITNEQSAIDAVASVGELLGITNATEELKVTQTNTIGTDTYYRMQQYYNGIPVYGRNVALAADENGHALGLTANSTEIDNVNTTPTLSEQEITKVVKDKYGDTVSVSNNGLVVYDLYNTAPTLAYSMVVSQEESCEEWVLSAKNGDILFRNDLIQTDRTHNASEYTHKVNDTTYVMYDKTRNLIGVNANLNTVDYKQIGNNLNNTAPIPLTNDGKLNENPNPLWDVTKNTNLYFCYSTSAKKSILICGDIQLEGSNNGKWDKDAASLMNTVENTYDFYKNILQRTGFDNKNSPMFITRNDMFEEGNNAYSYLGFLLAFGSNKNLKHTDLIAHEFTHSVEKSTVGMVDAGESDAIKEAYSDIFGELAEDYAKDGKMDGDCNWIHNGDRSLKNPNKSGNGTKYPTSVSDISKTKTFPKGKKIYYYIKEGCGSDYAHFASTVVSHAAYLMTQGTGGNEKIGNEALAHLWYNALFMLQPTADFAQCRNAVEMAAKIMVKNKQLTNSQLKTVRAAFDKVGIANAPTTYTKTVKNTFDLTVLNRYGSKLVDCELTMVRIKDRNGNIESQDPAQAKSEMYSITNTEKFTWTNGTYLLRLTDAHRDSTPVYIKLIVDNNAEDAVDNIMIYTDFLEVFIESEHKDNTPVDNNQTSYTLSGKITIADADTDMTNNRPLESATVQIRGNGVTKSVTTNAEGYYIIEDLSHGTYYATVQKDGYIPVTQTLQFENDTDNVYNAVIEAISQESSGVGYAGGFVYDVGTGRPVQGLTLSIRKELNNITGSVLHTLYTDQNGKYATPGLDAGNYTITIVDNRQGISEAERYTTSAFSVKILGNQTIDNQNGYVSNGLVSDELRVVLSWGSTPTDLDSHMVGPDASGGTFHEYYPRRADHSDTDLDTDDIDSYGPETITLYKEHDGTYVYSVHDYINKNSNNSTALSNSGATVQVLRGDQLLMTYHVPINQGGTLWTVFSYDSTTRKITTLNEMSYALSVS